MDSRGQIASVARNEAKQMLDKVAPDQMMTAPRQRVRAHAAVSFSLREGRTRLDRLAQQGSAKAILPRVHRDDPEVVFLNTAGGLTGGDRIAFDLTLGAGTRAVATSQTAERAYASLAETGPATMAVRLEVGAGARLDWLPQETILFDRAALHRRTDITLHGNAECLWCETLVLGRAAMGETVRVLDFADWRHVTRDGRPVLVEPMRLTSATLADAANPALLNDARAITTVALMAPDADRWLSRVMPLTDAPDVTAAAAAWDGKLVVRALAADAFALRSWLHRLLTELRGAPLPRVWTL